MHPILFHIGDVPVYSHGFFSLMGLVVGAVVLQREGQRRHWSRQKALPIALAAFVCGLVGARISLVFLNGWQTAPVVLDMTRLFDPTVGPGSILGGVIGAYIGGFAASRLIGLRHCACDAFAPAAGPGHVYRPLWLFFRLGGWPRNGNGPALGCRRRSGFSSSAPYAPLRRALNLAWFGVLVALRDRPALQDGNLLKVGLAGYAIFRFFVELVRTNRVLAWGLTPHQFLCIGILLAIGVYFGWRQVDHVRLGVAE